MFDRLFRGGREEPTELRECRRCGTRVGDDARRCPACESTDVATYSF